MAEPKATSKKKKSFTRKKKVVYDRVRFTVPEIFGDDDEFNLPNMRQMPFGVSREMRTNPQRFMNWIVDNATPEEAEAIDSLLEDESEIFMEAWGKASKAAPGKSSR